jgi:hypothetical protein
MVFVGFIRINIINTKALSPTVDGDKNYEMIKSEFGEDFEEFIKDGSEVKIYIPDEEKITVKIGDKEIFINDSNVFLDKVYDFGELAYNQIAEVTDKIIDKFNIDIKENNEDNIQNNDENNLDNIVDDFIQDLE